MLEHSLQPYSPKNEHPVKYNPKIILIFGGLIVIIIILSVYIFIQHQKINESNSNYGFLKVCNDDLKVQIVNLNNNITTIGMNNIEWLSFSDVEGDDIRQQMLNNIKNNPEDLKIMPRILLALIDIDNDGKDEAIAYVDLRGTDTGLDLERFSGSFEIVDIYDSGVINVKKIFSPYYIYFDEIMSPDGDKQFGVVKDGNNILGFLIAHSFYEPNA